MAKKKLFGSPRSDAAYAEVAKSGGGGDPFGDLFKTVAPKLIKAGATAMGGPAAGAAVDVAEKALKGDVEGALVDAAVGTVASQLKPGAAEAAEGAGEVAEGVAPAAMASQRDKVAAAQAKRDELEEAYFQKYRGYGML